MNARTFIGRAREDSCLKWKEQPVALLVIWQKAVAVAASAFFALLCFFPAGDYFSDVLGNALITYL
jgi:hypothetical protein